MNSFNMISSSLIFDNLFFTITDDDNDLLLNEEMNLYL